MATTTIYANKGASAVFGSASASSFGQGVTDYLPVGRYGGFMYRAYLAFSYSFTNWVSIESATLYLRTTSSATFVQGRGAIDIAADRVTEQWSEGTGDTVGSNPGGITWDDQPAATTINEGVTNVGASTETVFSFDITALMRDALTAGVFHGLRLLPDTVENVEGEITEFYSEETSFKPYITITYTANTAPNAPTNLSPRGDAVVNTTVPTLTGLFSDPDAGDTLSGVQLQMYEDDGVSLKWDSGWLAASGTSFSVVYSGPALTGNTDYEWRARTKDAGGKVGEWSPNQTFRANTVPLAPSVAINGAASDLTTLTPSFFITHNDPDVSDYNLEGYRAVVYRQSDGTVIWDTGEQSDFGTHTKTLAYTGPALSWQTGYYFIARTKDSNNAWGPYSGALAFTTHTTGTPTNLAPSGTASSLTPTFTGERSKSNDTLASYEIELYESDGQTLVWSSGSLAATTPTSFVKVYDGPALTQADTYKWRVRATGEIGGTSAWSSLVTFAAPDTNTPTVSAPIGLEIADLTPDLTFDRSTAFNAHEIEVYNSTGATLIWSTSGSGYADSTTKAVTYAGTALAWGTQYQWLVRVSADGGSVWSPWSALTAFTTNFAAAPTLTAPTAGSWETTLTPTFEGTTNDSETIVSYQIVVYADDAETVIWDSGELSGSGSSFSKVYTGATTLSRGSTYFWTAKYTATGDVPGTYAVPKSFHINALPLAPRSLSPSSGAVVGSLTPPFLATFVDADVAAWGDTPSVYDVEVYRVSDNTLMHSLTKNTGLVVGQNSVTRTTEGSDLAFDVDYSWRARYTDSKGAVGSWSQLRTFKPSEPPTVVLSVPNPTVSSPSFTITWTFSANASKTQQKYRVEVATEDDDVVVFDSGLVVSAATSYTIPSGYLQNATSYVVTVTVYDTDLIDASDSVTTLTSWTPPDALADFSVSADPVTSSVTLSWSPSALSAEDFSHYGIYRRVVGDVTWTLYDTVSVQSTTTYVDKYAANGVLYDYRVTQFQTIPGDVDLESTEETAASSILDVDDWVVVGANGSTFTLPVTQESHQTPVQQEIFEPLGSTRKKSARGYVLGNEGQFTLSYASDERLVGIANLNYIAGTPGPHVLKSPFGDVWRAEFSGPQLKYEPGGHLSATITWIEVD